MGASLSIDRLSSGGSYTLDQVRGVEVQRVDTDAWETGQTGVEYYAPNQYGRIYGTVYRQYYAATIAGSDITIDSSFAGAHILNAGGYAHNNSGNRDIVIGTYVSGITSACIYAEPGSTDLNLKRGSGFDDADDSYSLWVDYTK